MKKAMLSFEFQSCDGSTKENPVEFLYYEMREMIHSQALPES